MSTFMLKEIKVKENILTDPFFKHVFSVEEVNDLVLKGVPFRDAYKQVGYAIEKNDFQPDQEKVAHTHEGSIGNLCSEEIRGKMEQSLGRFEFEKVGGALEKLIHL